MNVLVSYWTSSLHPAILISAGIVSYAAMQLYSVRVFGEVEFWLSITKVFLMIGLTAYTIVSMLGGNPMKDRYGFRFWKTPGPFVGKTPALRMKGVFDALIWCCFA
jgi:amino acid transporter